MSSNSELDFEDSSSESSDDSSSSDDFSEMLPVPPTPRPPTPEMDFAHFQPISPLPASPMAKHSILSPVASKPTRRSPTYSRSPSPHASSRPSVTVTTLSSSEKIEPPLVAPERKNGRTAPLVSAHDFKRRMERKVEHSKKRRLDSVSSNSLEKIEPSKKSRLDSKNSSNSRHSKQLIKLCEPASHISPRRSEKNSKNTSKSHSKSECSDTSKSHSKCADTSKSHSKSERSDTSKSHSKRSDTSKSHVKRSDTSKSHVKRSDTSKNILKSERKPLDSVKNSLNYETLDTSKNVLKPLDIAKSSDSPKVTPESCMTSKSTSKPLPTPSLQPNNNTQNLTLEKSKDPTTSDSAKDVQPMINFKIPKKSASQDGPSRESPRSNVLPQDGPSREPPRSYVQPQRGFNTNHRRSYFSHNDNRRWRSNREYSGRHKKCLAVLCIRPDGFTLTNGSEYQIVDGLVDRQKLLEKLQLMNVLHLIFTEKATKHKFEELFQNIPNFHLVNNIKQNTLMPPNNLESCVFCNRDDCHRWLAVVGGIAQVLHAPIDPIEH